MQNAFKTLISGILEAAKSYKGDWNENDSSSPNYIKNRTHYAIEGDVVLFENYSISIESGPVTFPLPDDKGLIIGETYKVIWDEIEYNCKAFEFEGMSVIGNMANIGVGNDTGEPFFVATGIAYYDTAEGGNMGVAFGGQGEHVFSIYKKCEVVHKLDKKYLPEDIDEVIKDKFHGGIGYMIPAGTELVNVATNGGSYALISDTIFLSSDWYYYVSFNGFNGYLETYMNGGDICLGNLDEHGFQLYQYNGVVMGEFDVSDTLIVRTDEDSPVRIDSRFIDVQLPEDIITQDNIVDNLPQNVVTIDEISKVATTGNYDDLKFKPCGIETTRTEFMNYEVTVNSTSTNKEAAEGYAFYRKMPEEGKMYEVICRRQSAYDNYEFYSYRGVMRKCPNPNDPNTYLNDLYIGNLWLDHPTYENTGEPFCMRFSPQSSNPQVSVYLLKNKIFSSGAAYDNYTLYEIEEGSIKALDERLLPYSYAKQDEVYTKEDVYTKEETYSTIDKTTTITWDGNADNRDKFTVAGVERKFCKVSEPIFLASESNFQSDDVVTVGDPLLLPTFNHSGDGIKIINGVAIVDAAGSYNIYFDPNSPGVSFTVTVPSPGIYFQGGRYTQVHVSSVTISSECRSLPEDVMGVVRTVNNITPDDNGNVNISIDGLSIKEYIDETIGGIENGTY